MRIDLVHILNRALEFTNHKFKPDCPALMTYEKTRPNEFGSMTARKGDIKPQYYKGQTWLFKTTGDHARPYKTKRGHIRPHTAIQYHNVP